MYKLATVVLNPIVAFAAINMYHKILLILAHYLRPARCFMEQGFACPHCGQTLSAPASMAGVEVQCIHCSGRSIIPDLAAAATASAPDPLVLAGNPSPGSPLGWNRKLILAGGAVLAFACLPALLYGVLGGASTPATVAAGSASSASSQAAGASASPAATPVAINTPPVMVPTPTVANNMSPRADASRSNPAPLSGSFRSAAAAAAAKTPGGPTRSIASAATTAPRVAAAEGQPGPARAAPNRQPATATQLVEQVEPSVVIIDTGDGLGSGFVYDGEGTVVTNYHVIEGAKQAEIKFSDQSSAPVTGFLVVSPGKDLAILRFSPAGRKLKPLAVAARRPSKGESVLAFGAPRGLGSTVSDGIVSSIRQGTELRDTFKAMTKVDVYVEHLHYDLDAVWIQTTAPISGGNSGGPLMNLQAQVVGLNTWNRTDGQNLNFAISAEHIKKLMESTQSGLQPLANLPAPREKTFAAGLGGRTLEYWEDVSRINRALAGRIKKLRPPPLPADRQKLLMLFPKLAGIYQKLGDWLPETAVKLKDLKIDDVDRELVALVAADAIYLEKIAEEFRSMAVDAKMLNKVVLLDTAKLATKSYGEFDELELSAAYDIMRIKLTNRYGLTFASIFSEVSRGKSNAKSDGEAAGEEPAESGDAEAARERQAAGKLRLAKSLKDAGKLDVAKQRLEQVVQDYPGTKAANEAADLLAEL